MNKYIYIIVLLFFIACDKDNEEETILELPKSEFMFIADGGTDNLEITSNTLWSIEGSIPEWLEINPKEGSGTATIKITTIANPDEIERSVSLTIIAKELQKKINIKQLAKNISLALSTNELEIEDDPKEEISFQIVSNDEWIIIDKPDWLKLSVESGKGNATISIKAEKNYVDSERTCTLQIKSGSKTEELKITQKAFAATIELYFSNMELTSSSLTRNFEVYCEGGKAEVMIHSNTKWGVSSSDEWINIDKEEGIGNEVLKIAIGENTTVLGRRGKITIAAGSESIFILVSQGGVLNIQEHPLEINMRDNGPRYWDILNRRQVNYIDPGEAGENVTWNFSSLQFYRGLITNYEPAHIVGDKYVLGKDEIPIENIQPNSLFVRSEGHATEFQDPPTSYRYFDMIYCQLKDNYELTLGYENVANLARYSPRMHSNVFSQTYNTSINNNYQYEGLYSGATKYKYSGYQEIKTDAYGTLILPEGTYKDVLRIKIVSTEIGIGDYSDDDETETISYKWYAKGYRYPIFETNKRIYKSTGEVISSGAVHFPAEDHTYLNKSPDDIINLLE